MDNTKVAQFIQVLADDKTAGDHKSHQARSQERDFLLSGAISKLDKKTIRDGMTFTITKDSKTFQKEMKEGKVHDSTETGKKVIQSFDERGQEHEIDTFDSTRKGIGISKEDQAKVQKAMEMVVAFANEVMSMKTSDGSPVFDPMSPKYEQEIMDEVFTPLVRERILPENLVLDKYSEVHRLLKNTINNYKKTLEDSRQSKIEKIAKSDSGLAGSRGHLDRMKAIGDKVSQLKGRIVDKIGKENVQNMMFTKDLASLAYSAYKAERNVEGWIPDENGITKNVWKEEVFLDPKAVFKLSEEQGEKKYGVEGWRYLKSTLGQNQKGDYWDDTVGEKNYTKDGWASIKDYQTNYASKGMDVSNENLKELYPKTWESIVTYRDSASDEDYQRGVIENAKSMKKMNKVFSKFAEATGLENDPTLESIRKFLATPSSDKVATDKFYTFSSLELGKELLANGIDLGTIGYDLHKFEGTIKKLLREESAGELARKIIDSIDDVITTEVRSIAGRDAGDAVEGVFASHLKPSKIKDFIEPKTDGGNLLETIASALDAFLSPFTPKCGRVGQALGKGLRTGMKGSDFLELYETNPDHAVDAIVKAVQQGLKSNTKAIEDAFFDKDTLRQIVAGTIFGDEDEETGLVQEMEEADEEIRQFENMLVLIDGGGVSAAQQKSIEVLIQEIEKDRKVIAMVLSIGSTVEGLTGPSMGIAGWATEKVTDEIIGEVMGPLKAAKLILEFAASVKKAVERVALMKSFKADLARAKVAVSSLSSTIQGFYDNKKEQVAFRSIEQALLLIQIAAEIVGSVPTPITLAVGKTMSKLTSLLQKTEKLIEKRYNHEMLKKAWKTTSDAIANPGNRKLGLKALRLNPSLGMHALAWAATELQPPDPIARMVLNSVGLDETTLAVSGSEDKVRQYLLTILDEDRDLTDLSKLNFDAELNTNWAPPPELSAKCWVILINRAMGDIKPRLANSEKHKSIVAALKAVQSHPKPDTLSEEGPSADLKKYVDDIQLLLKLLQEYEPKSAEGSDHFDMENEVSRYIDLASDLQDRVRSIFRARREKEDRLDEMIQLSEFVQMSLDQDDKLFEEMFDPKEFEFHLDRFKKEFQTVDTYTEFETRVQKAKDRLEEEDDSV